MIVLNLWIWIVAANRCNLCRLPIACTYLSTLREIDNYRTWTTCTCNIESTAYSPSHILWTTYLITPLADRLSQTHKVYLLECISTKSAYTYLSSNNHDWGRVDHRIGYTSQCIGNTRTACHQTYSDITTNTRETFCSMSSCLFMTHENMIENFFLASCIIV